MRFTIVALAILHLILSVHAEPEIRGTASELVQFISGATKTVTVGGESEVRVAASRAVLTVSAITENKL